MQNGTLDKRKYAESQRVNNQNNSDELFSFINTRISCFCFFKFVLIENSIRGPKDGETLSEMKRYFFKILLFLYKIHFIYFLYDLFNHIT